MSFVKDLVRQAYLPIPLCFMSDFDMVKVLKSVCALLNGDGGWIALGIENDKTVVGLPSDFSSTQLQQELTDQISPLPLVYIQDEDWDGKKVALLTVMKGSLPPYSYQGRFFVSDGKEAVSPDYKKMASLIRSSTSYQDKWELYTCITAEEDDLDDALMESVYNRGKGWGRVVLNDDSHMTATLSRLHLLNASFISNGVMALFGRNVPRFFPQCRVRIQAMLNGKTANEYQDVRVIEGNLFKTHESVLDYFRQLPHVAFFSNIKGYRDEDYAYPMTVLDEAVTNALIHRDFNGLLDEITVFVYRNRVEITNPGEMFEKFIVNGKVKPRNSILRNPLMAEVFYMAGLMEKSGRGLSLICDEMQAKGLKKPVWKSANGYTTLTLYSSKEKTAETNERMRQFLSEHRKGFVFTKADYMSRFEPISKITAQADIKQMLQLKLCIAKGNGPSTKYELL